MFDTDRTTPVTELTARIAKFQTRLDKEGIDGAFIIQNSDLFYFAGTIQQGVLYIPASGKVLFMVRKNVERALAESKTEHMVFLQSSRDIPELLKDFGHGTPSAIGMELDVLPANQLFGFQKLFGSSRITDISTMIRMIRSIKSPYELSLLRKAAACADIVSGCVPQLVAAGMTEIELAGKIEAAARKLGHQGIIRMRLWGSELFYGHLMTGPAAAVPSYLASPTGGRALSPAVGQGPSHKKIKPHEPILVDYVFALDGYLADHARIFSIGRLDSGLRDAHERMLDLQAEIMGAARPGVSCETLYNLAVTRTREFGYEDYFMGADAQRIKFIGHGIGLELDEFPFLAMGQQLELAEGMVLALEPKLIFPGKGVVGIENTHVVTGAGLERLTKHPDTVNLCSS